MVEETESLAPSRDERTLAVLAHVLQFMTWWIGPLVIFLVRRESRFVSFHALQALIYQGLLFVARILMMGFWFALIFTDALVRVGRGKPSMVAPIAFVIVFGLFWVGIWALTLVLGLVYGIKASRGEWAAYPIIGRWARRLAGINHSDQP